MKTYVINPKQDINYGSDVVTGNTYDILGAISGYDNVIFEFGEESNCKYGEDVTVVIHDAHDLTNRQAWWVKHLIDQDCVTVILVGNTTEIRSILNEGSIVVDESRNRTLSQLLELARG